MPACSPPKPADRERSAPAGSALQGGTELEQAKWAGFLDLIGRVLKCPKGAGTLQVFQVPLHNVLTFLETVGPSETFILLTVQPLWLNLNEFINTTTEKHQYATVYSWEGTPQSEGVGILGLRAEMHPALLSEFNFFLSLNCASVVGFPPLWKSEVFFSQLRSDRPCPAVL